MLMLPQTGFLWGVLMCGHWLNSDSNYTSRTHHSRCSFLSRTRTTKTRTEGSLQDVRTITESLTSIAPGTEALGGVEPRDSRDGGLWNPPAKTLGTSY